MCLFRHILFFYNQYLINQNFQLTPAVIHKPG